MSGFVARLDRVLYPEFERNWDDQLFRERILAHLRPSDVPPLSVAGRFRVRG